MNKQRFLIRSKQIKDNALSAVNEIIPDDLRPLVVEINPITRTLEQNAKLHAMLTDISKQLEFNGKKQNVDTWKALLVSGHKIATEGVAEMAIGLEGEVINLRESTAQMSVKRLASLIEYIYAYGIGQGVKFRDY